VKAAINKLYGSNTGNDSLLSKRFFDFGPPEPESGSQSGPAKRDAPTNCGPTKRREYIANIVSDKFSCNGSYAVYIFLGTFDASDPACWPTQPNLVGTHAVFATVPQEATDDGTIPLNSALLEKAKAGEMRSRNPGHVEDYLTNNLQYRVARVSFHLLEPVPACLLTRTIQFDGTEIPIAEVPNLSVSVVGADVTPATKEDQFPRWNNFQSLRRVTDGIGARCAA
jgi:tyrosinase